MDILPPILIAIAEVIHFTGDLTERHCVIPVVTETDTVYIECYRNVVIRCLYAITSFAIWMRFLYFFRVFKATGYYIRMIVEVVNDMG